MITAQRLRPSPRGRPGYDPQAHLQTALRQGPLPGAIRQPLEPLSRLADQIGESAVVVVSDVHGDIERLRFVLAELGLIDDQGQRLPADTTLIQIGDLVDGRDPADAETLRFGSQVFDVILAGNHEAALLGGKSFGGQPVADPEVRSGLNRLVREDRLQAAYNAHGVLITHAGVNRHLYQENDPDRLAEAINEEFTFFAYRTSHQPTALFAHTAHRGRGGRDEFGGVLWQDFSQLVQPDQHDPTLRQLVGHSVLGGVEADPDGQVTCIDTAGPRLGVAVIAKDGAMTFGSDWLDEQLSSD
jgi:hypothetical protein